ncbi:AfsR/SARP family transcriptional regulator [Streptomyces malaysiensis]|uniref:Winged helix family transcriptional regulator n=1 Tax=Streptomyces malaysiensis TaxID=92644 RepID=A0A7X6AWJ6_STRMQ|nr:BTAD domain-containing putative transcriptional regulator [Streptomyces malaysiensis]NIY64988.1 winged helix family transcriptional regulator [Streptomyces malaysiensis]
MRYGILGTTQARHDDGTPVDIGGARLRALLTALALAAGRARTTGALIGEIWDTDPPADEQGALQALVGRLRRALGKDAVESVPGGYRLSADPDDIDLHRFERLADEGTRALADGDPAKAVDLLDAALGLWRGPALSDLPDATAPAARAEARRLEARRARLAADLALGRAGQALPALTGLCDAHPLDEPLHALRIRALRDAGRAAEALAAYEEIRTEIAERLGVDPGPELRALHAELLGASREGFLVVRPGSAAAGSISSDPVPSGLASPGPVPSGRVSSGRVPSGPVPSGPVSSGRVPSGPVPSGPASPGPVPGRTGGGNLRARLTSFVGREGDLVTLRGDLAGHRLITLLGPGGAGKTRLSQEAAESAASAWPDGVWLAELAPVDDPETVPETVLSAVGGRETVILGTAAEGLRAAADPTVRDPRARLIEHCAPRRMLIVLDNCEHLVEAAAHLAESLLAHCPGVTILATSREPLAVPGELVRPVEPLPDPVALRLLQDRGAAARPGFRTEDDPAACAEICRRLDGLPLAIELAAARLRLLTPRQLADRLDDRFRLLTSGSRTALPRQQTLRAVVDWSWGLLDAAERTVLARLSVFAGGCGLAEAEAVCGGAEGRPGGVEPRDVAVLLGSLIDKSLVVTAPAAEPGADGEMRYRLLETVAEYAAERLDESGERAAVERRHLVAYRELARTADPLLRGPAQRHWMVRLETEHENLRTALRRAVAARDEQEALCLVLSLGWFWHLRGHRAESRHWATAAAELGPSPFAPPVAPAPPLHISCTAAPPPMEPELLMEARRGVRLFALANIEGDLQAVVGEDTQRELEGIVAAYRAGLPQTCRLPGVLWFFAVVLKGDLGMLREMADESVRTCRELGYEWELAFTLQLRARIYNERSGENEGAIRDADEALEIFRRIGDTWGAAEALAGRGETREQRGEGAAAAADYRAAIRCAQDLGAHEQVLWLRARLAGVFVEFGDEEEAAKGERMLREVVEQGPQVGAEALAYARVHLAQHCGTTGRVGEARALLVTLHGEFERRALELFEGMAEGMLAWVDLLEGRPDDALATVRGGLVKTSGRMTGLIAPFIPVTQLLTAAEALSALGGPERAETAARLVGAYDTLRKPQYYRRSAIERIGQERTETAARAELGDDAYERVHAEGMGLTLEEAVALV